MKHFVLLSFLLFMSIGLFAQSRPCPCCTPAHRQFDFWLGDWQAYRPDGQLAGTNHIVLLQDSCILQENWKSAKGGYTGTSYNYFDAQDSTWNQLWIDNRGGQLILKGHRTGNQMILFSDATPDASGHTIVHRITWTANNDGTVRQHWESTKDDGKWVTVFDGLYQKQ